MLSPGADDHHHHTKKKRVGKACDLCRIKKTKCDGRKPCLRCLADNKLCAFTEKKRQKEKSHPSGYIELLETRLDLLTKSLEKIVTLAEPHLPVLQDLMASARAEHAQLLLPEESEDPAVRDGSYVPINEVVAHLISDMGLLDNSTMDWEKGAQIAANLVSRSSGTKLASDALGSSGEDEPSPPPHRKFSHSRASSSVLVDSPMNVAGRLAENIDIDDLSLGEYAQAHLQQPQAQLSQFLVLDSFPEKANLLFIRNDDAVSLLPVSSVTNHLEASQTMEEARLRRLSLLKAPMLPLLKLKHDGHIRKPSHVQHLLMTNVVQNNGNQFHVPKSLLSMHLLPDYISLGLLKNLEEILGNFANDFISQLSAKDTSALLDNDEVLLSNPFLSSW